MAHSLFTALIRSDTITQFCGWRIINAMGVIGCRESVGMFLSQKGESSGGHFVQPLCSGRATQSQVPRKLLNISSDGDNHLPGQPVPLHPCSRKCFLVVRGSLLGSSLLLLPLVLSQGTIGKSLACPWHSGFRYLYVLMRSPEPARLQPRQS